MDFVEDILTSEFVFNNPNIKGTCGCGESFNIQCFMIGTAIQLAIAYKSKYKKVGVLVSLLCLRSTLVTLRFLATAYTGCNGIIVQTTENTTEL